MRPSSALLAVLFLALAQCSQATPTDSLDQSVAAAVNGPIALKSLQPGDVLTVHLDSQGCFHHWIADLAFEGDAESNIHVSGSAAPALPPTAPTTLKAAAGIVKPDRVPVSLLGGLDRVLERLRAPQQGFCTTQTDYRLALYRDGVLVREEQLHDSMCGGFLEEDKASFFQFVGAALDQAYAAMAPSHSGA